MLLPVTSAISKAFKENVLAHMKYDEIYDAIVGDALIMKRGEIMYRLMRKASPNVIKCCRDRLPELGRLLIAIKKPDSSETGLYSVLSIRGDSSLCSVLLRT